MATKPGSLWNENSCWKPLS